MPSKWRLLIFCYLGLCLVALALAACDSDSSPKDVTSEARLDSLSPSATPTLSSITDCLHLAASPGNNIAPSYSDIVQAELCILGGLRPITKDEWLQAERKNKGKGITDEQNAVLDSLYSSLKGKRVDGWHGWVASVGKIENTTAPGTYTYDVHL